MLSDASTLDESVADYSSWNLASLSSLYESSEVLPAQGTARPPLSGLYEIEEKYPEVENHPATCSGQSVNAESVSAPEPILNSVQEIENVRDGETPGNKADQRTIFRRNLWLCARCVQLVAHSSAQFEELQNFILDRAERVLGDAYGRFTAKIDAIRALGETDVARAVNTLSGYLLSETALIRELALA